MVESGPTFTIPFTYKKIFSPEECTEIINAFKHYDTSKDGNICVNEFKLCLKDMGRSDVSEEQLNELFKTYDRNSDDNIDFNEFLDMFSALKEQKKIGSETEHSKGSASQHVGASGHHTYLHEEAHVCTRLFNKILAKDEFVSDRIPMAVDGEDLFHAMHDGMMLIRLLVAIDPDCVDMRVVNKGNNLNIYKVRENINYGLTCA